MWEKFDFDRKFGIFSVAFWATQVKPKSRHSRMEKKRWKKMNSSTFSYLKYYYVSSQWFGVFKSASPRAESRNSRNEMKTKYNEDRGKRVSNIDLLESLPQRHFTSSLSFIHISLVSRLVSRTHSHTRRNSLFECDVEWRRKNARKWKW